MVVLQLIITLQQKSGSFPSKNIKSNLCLPDLVILVCLAQCSGVRCFPPVLVLSLSSSHFFIFYLLTCVIPWKWNCSSFAQRLLCGISVGSLSISSLNL